MKSSKRSSRLRKRSRKGYRRHLNKSSARTISPSKLWILLFVSLFPSQYLVAAGYVAHGVYRANVYEDPSQMNPMDYARFRRDAASQLHTSVENLQHLARIANAAHLQTAISQKLPIDDFLAEILHLDDLKLNDVSSLDQSQFDAVVKDLENLSKNLPTSKETTDIEDRLVLLEEMGKNAEYFKDFDKFPGKDDFKTDLAKVEDVKNSGYDKLKDAAINFQGSVKAAKGLPRKVDAKNVDKAVIKLTAILSFFDDLETSATNFKTEILKNAKTFGKGSNFLDLLIAEHKNRQQLNAFQYDRKPVTTVWNNFKSLTATSTKVGDSLTIKTIEKIVSNREKGYKQKYQYTAGFPAGSSDLKELQLSVSHAFIQKHVPNSQIVIESLKTSFNPFVALVNSLKSLEEQWKNSKTIADFMNTIGKIASVSKNPAKRAEELKKCHEGISSFPMRKIDPVETMRKSISSLTTELQKISEFDSVPEFKDLNARKSGFVTKGKTGEDLIKFVQKALDDFETSDMKGFEGKVAELHKELQTLENVMTSYGPTTFDLTDVETYHTSIITSKNHLTIYSCLAKGSSGNSPTKATIEAIRESRTFSVTTETHNALKEFIKSKEYLPNVRLAVEKLKNVQDQEKSILVGIFKDGKYSSVSKNLGLGVQGLQAIEKVHAAQEKLKPLIANADAISKHVSLSKEQKDNLSKLSDLPNVFKSIDTFLQKNLVVSRRKRDVNFNSAASKLFAEAAQVVGVKIDMKHFREGMEALHTLDPKSFPAPLDELKTLNFDFSSFPFKEAGSSLATMDQFFVEYARQIRSAIPPPGKTIILPQKNPQQKNTANALAATEEAEGFTGLKKFIKEHPGTFWGITGGVALIICVVVFIVVWCCCCRGEKERTDSDPNPRPDPDPNPEPDNTKIEHPKIIDTSDESSDEGGKEKGGKKEKKTKKKRSADNDEKKDDTSTEGPSTGGVSVPKVPIVDDKEKSLPLEKTQKSLDDAMSLIRTTVTTMSGRFDEYCTPTVWAKKLLDGHNTASRQTMTNEDMKFNQEQRRHCNQMLVKKTLAKLGPKYKGKNTFININEMPYKGRVMLLGQGAQAGNEIGDKNQTLIDTREKQYHVFDNYDVRVVAQLCQFIEGGRSKCGQYYPLVVNEPVKYGKYEVTTTKINVDPPQFMGKGFSAADDFVLYTVKYKHDDDNVEKYVDILLCKGIPDHDVPRNHEMGVAIIEFLDSYNSNIFIHCSAGIGRTGAFAAIMCGVEICNNQDVESIIDIIQYVRNHRGQLIQTPMQLLFVIRVIGEILMRQRGVVQYDELSKFDYYYQEALKGTYECDPKTKKVKDFSHLCKNHKKQAEAFMVKDRERLKEDPHPVKIEVNTTREPEKQDNIQDDWKKRQADLYKEACKAGKEKKSDEKKLEEKVKKEKDPKKTEQKKSGEEVKDVKDTKKSEQKNPEKRVKKSAEKDTKKKAASKMKAPSKEMGGASKEKHGAEKKKK